MTNLGKSDRRFPAESHDDTRKNRNRVRCDRYGRISFYFRHTRRCLNKNIEKKRDRYDIDRSSFHVYGMIKLIQSLKIHVYSFYSFFVEVRSKNKRNFDINKIMMLPMKLNNELASFAKLLCNEKEFRNNHLWVALFII